jgi:hypothetical protein
MGNGFGLQSYLWRIRARMRHALRRAGVTASGRHVGDSTHLPGQYAVGLAERVRELDPTGLRDERQLALDRERRVIRDEEGLRRGFDLSQPPQFLALERRNGLSWFVGHRSALTWCTAATWRGETVYSHLDVVAHLPPVRACRPSSGNGPARRSSMLCLSYAPGGVRLLPIHAEQQNEKPHPRRFRRWGVSTSSRSR